ncbi:hypothetical protein SAMN04487895_10337 [Paenibacillus sophorae]|uniref:Uncharacterized protein n=1 Tax=Paenibacillus sophorae TaxID=1333845 RepID=A0A1H8JJS9_9BACL|nr:hypothetical protein [Paenibacillus sophorae]QWU13374.1 hypothetical protein KP014_15340 [Paenibacillus sophorae]SEN80518.1 hypothetical protein SAMN04487895_10337 [Paenibacillus sophorae]
MKTMYREKTIIVPIEEKLTYQFRNLTQVELELLKDCSYKIYLWESKVAYDRQIENQKNNKHIVKNYEHMEVPTDCYFIGFLVEQDSTLEEEFKKSCSTLNFDDYSHEIFVPTVKEMIAFFNDRTLYHSRVAKYPEFPIQTLEGLVILSNNYYINITQTTERCTSSTETIDDIIDINKLLRQKNEDETTRNEREFLLKTAKKRLDKMSFAELKGKVQYL